MAAIGLYKLCLSKTNHWGWKGKLWWRRETCFSPAKASAMKLSATREKRSFLSIRHRTGCQFCLCSVSQSRILCSAYRCWFAGSPTPGLWVSPRPAWHLLQLSPGLLRAGYVCMEPAVRKEQPLCQKNHSLSNSYPSKQHLRQWGKGLPVKWHLTWICKTLAAGASLSLTCLCQTGCPQPSSVCNTFSGLSPRQLLWHSCWVVATTGFSSSDNTAPLFHQKNNWIREGFVTEVSSPIKDHPYFSDIQIP